MVGRAGLYGPPFLRTQGTRRRSTKGEAVFLELIRDVDAGEELCLAYSEYAREGFGIR